jgi:hypothetical protein
MSGAPVKKLPASARVGLPGVSVANRDGESVNIGFSNFGPAAAISSGIHALEARVTIENSALKTSSIVVP